MEITLNKDYLKKLYGKISPFEFKDKLITLANLDKEKFQDFIYNSITKTNLDIIRKTMNASFSLQMRKGSATTVSESSPLKPRRATAALWAIVWEAVTCFRLPSWDL